MLRLSLWRLGGAMWPLRFIARHSEAAGIDAKLETSDADLIRQCEAHWDPITCQLLLDGGGGITGQQLNTQTSICCTDLRQRA